MLQQFRQQIIETIRIDINLQDRFRGAILGVACGDAVGTTLELKHARSRQPMADMIGGEPLNLESGQWCDDTAMMLCLGNSLVMCEGFNAIDQMKRYKDWFENNSSSNGKSFDVGNTIYNALQKFSRTGDAYCGSSDSHTAGNGSLMRLAPIPLAYHNDPVAAMESAKLSSQTTHGARAAIDACRYMTALIVGALQGVPKIELLSDNFSLAERAWQNAPPCSEIKLIYKGSYKENNETIIIGSGNAAKSLEAALWAFHSTTTFEDGCLKAANTGHDANTTAAIYGQLAGAFYGINGIPERWRQRLAIGHELESLADALLMLSCTVSSHNKEHPLLQKLNLLLRL